MNLPSLPFLAGGAFLLLVAASPPAAPHLSAQPTQAELAKFQGLLFKLGECHRIRAVALARTNASVEQIVSQSLAACEPRVAPLLAMMAKYDGAAEARRKLAGQRGHWRDAIRRNVAAARVH